MRGGCHLVKTGSSALYKPVCKLNCNLYDRKGVVLMGRGTVGAPQSAKHHYLELAGEVVRDEL